MKISLSTFVYFRYSLSEAIRHIAAIGYEAVEIWGGRPHAYADDMDAAHLRETRNIIQDQNLTISNFIPAQFRYPVNIAIADETIRKGSLEYLKKSIDAAVELGAPYVSLCPGFSILPQTASEARDTLIKSLNELVNYADGMPLTLLLEPAHRMETDLVITIEEGLEVVKALNGKMGLLPDTGHIFISRKDLAEAVEKTSEIPCHWHIDDNQGFSDDHLIPGEGKINFHPFLKALIQSGYDGAVAVELGYSYILDPDTAAQKSLENLQRLMKEVNS